MRRLLAKWCFTTLLCTLTTVSIAHDGIYLTAELGWAEPDGLPSAQASGALSIQNDTFPVSHVGLGYLHDFTSWYSFGFEAGYGIYSNTRYLFADGNINNVSISILDFMTINSFHLNSSFDLFIKAGGLRNTPTITSEKGRVISDKTRIQGVFGFGANYNITQNFAITATYYHTLGQTVPIVTDDVWEAPSMNILLVGLRLNFSSEND